jgi:hypothetical protein
MSATAAALRPQPEPAPIVVTFRPGRVIAVRYLVPTKSPLYSSETLFGPSLRQALNVMLQDRLGRLPEAVEAATLEGFRTVLIEQLSGGRRRILAEIDEGLTADEINLGLGNLRAEERL